MGPEAKGAPGPPRYATRGIQVAVSGGRGKGGNPVDALLVPDSPLNVTERHVQQAFMRSGLFNGLIVGAAVVAGFAVMHRLPERHARPDALLPLRFVPAALSSGASPLRLAGAWEMVSVAGERRLGGLSALAADGNGLIAVSDLGAVLRFDRPTASRPLIRVTDLRQGPGDPGKKRSRDSESLVRDPHGRGWWIGYEQRHSLWLYDRTFQRPLAAIRLPKLGWRANRGAEGLLARDGALLALGENGRDAVRIGKGEPQVLKLHGGMEIAEAATAPDGSAWVLLRAKDLAGISQSIAPLLKTHDGFRVGPRWALPKAAFDNYEGLAITAREDGRWRFWLVTDDGHRFMARTLLVALDLDLPIVRHDKGPARGAGPL